MALACMLFTVQEGHYSGVVYSIADLCTEYGQPTMFYTMFTLTTSDL